jgi:cytochrome c oxidase assembly protein subunit 11
MVNAQSSANLLTLRKLLVVAVAMFGFGFALVPFYKKICEVTGINQVVKGGELVNTQIETGRLIRIEFDSNLQGNIPWTFRPLQTSVRVHPGEMTIVDYEIRNNSTRTMTAQAIPSYGPVRAGRYFKKLECFCFTQQTLQPGETRRMPVQFVIEPGLPDDFNTITLSYSFFEVNGTAKTPG